MSQLSVGTFCRVKDTVWREWCTRHGTEYQPFQAQPIVHLPNHPPYEGRVMLAFPFYWWNEDELEIDL